MASRRVLGGRGRERTYPQPVAFGLGGQWAGRQSHHDDSNHRGRSTQRRWNEPVRRGGQALPNDASLRACRGQALELVPPVETLASAPGFRKYDFTFKCAAPDDLQIHSGAFFDRVVSHTNFAQIQNAATGEFTEQLINNEHQTVDVTGGAGWRLKSARFFEFIKMGTMHIFTGVDHMSFCWGWCSSHGGCAPGLCGHGFHHRPQLDAGAGGNRRSGPHAEYIDALVALTIALIGAENIVVQTGQSASLRWPWAARCC